MKISDQLDYLIEPMGALCQLSSDSHINRKPIDIEDFVNKYDHDPEHAQEYGCGNMQADEREPDITVCRKYGITEDEFIVIAYEISMAVSFGACGLCV